MIQEVVIIKNRYIDSVSLMSATDTAKAMLGVESSNVSMGTAANREIAAKLGFTVPEDTSANDLIIAIAGEEASLVEQAIHQIQEMLNHGKKTGAEKEYHSLDDIDMEADAFDLVQISLPGEYAAAEAEKALNKNLDVFMFSDNVSIEDEIRLKELALSKGRLMMGPDCGVAFIKGVALAVGSTYKKGPVGIVGASGSGAQEVGCILERLGYGLSSLIGTGGRDLYRDVRGMMMREGIRRLEKDRETEVIVLVSKLADQNVMNDVLCFADHACKPVVAVFLGAEEDMFAGHTVYSAFSLEEAAKTAVQLLGGNTDGLGFSEEEIASIVHKQMSGYSKKQKYFRGLYCGGTFAEEGLIFFSRNVANVKLHSNLNTAYADKLLSSLKSEGHSVLDLGSEEFTKSSPHPVFDPEIRLKRFREEIQDESVAVILLDFITGPGVAKDPAGEFAKEAKAAIRERHITVISSICGSAEDPQGIYLQAEKLKDAGVIVTDSNYQSTRLAAALMTALNEGR